MSDERRFRVVENPLTEETLNAAVASAMDSLEGAFDAAHVSIERQLAYRSIVRECLTTLAGHLCDANLQISLPGHLSEEDLEQIVTDTVASIEAIYLQLVITAVDSICKTVLVAVESKPPPLSS